MLLSILLLIRLMLRLTYILPVYPVRNIYWVSVKLFGKGYIKYARLGFNISSGLAILFF